jgi:HEAT repeat protein
MKIQRIIGVITLVVAAVMAGSSFAQRLPKGDAEDLVQQLATNKSASPPVAELERRIAALGIKALPALEEELRLGIPFRKLNNLLGAGNSRRYAVVRVLARIPGEQSTDLLLMCLSDPPDNYAMRSATLIALSQRTLSSDQIVAMLGNHEPRVVLAGIDHAVNNLTLPKIKAAVETVLDKDAAVSQFRNEYGASTASSDALWEVRLAAGKALMRDMVPAMRARAKQILTELRREALQPTKPNTSAWISYGSQAENTICRCLGKLTTLGDPVKDLVEGAVKEAKGDHAKVLDMALARLGDRTRVAQVTNHLISAKSHTMRFCAAVTLRILGDRSTISALRKALRDPYHRQDGSCLRIGDGEIYPVRLVAADALIELGEDPKQIRREMRK